MTVNANCSGNCSFSSWYLTANVTDVSGIQSVRVLRGNGTLSTTSFPSDTEINVTMIDYRSSCCSRELELVAVDGLGNVATCFKSTAAPSMLTYGAEFSLWLNIGLSIFRFMQL